VPSPQNILHTPGGSRIRVRSYPAGLSQPAHAHAETTLTLVVRGALEERVGPRAQCAGPMSVVVKPAGTEHANLFGPSGTTTLQVTLSAHDAARLDPGRRLLHRWRWVHAPAAARSMIDLLRLAGGRAPSPGDGRNLAEDLLRELLVALAPPADPTPHGPPVWLAEARASLDRGEASIRALAGRLGLHPVHLAHAFRRHQGVGPSEYRRRARIRRAAALIVDSERPLVEIAYECGFADQAHMTRSLRLLLGETPAGLRRLAGAA
jgi:AraC family transcriptional regulator